MRSFADKNNKSGFMRIYHYYQLLVREKLKNGYITEKLNSEKTVYI